MGQGEQVQQHLKGRRKRDGVSAGMTVRNDAPRAAAAAGPASASITQAEANKKMTKLVNGKGTDVVNRLAQQLSTDGNTAEVILFVRTAAESNYTGHVGARVETSTTAPELHAFCSTPPVDMSPRSHVRAWRLRPHV